MPALSSLARYCACQRRWTGCLSLLLLAALGLALPAAGADRVTLDIKLFRYQPQTVEVPVGTTIVWTNRDDIEHTVTSKEDVPPELRFDSPGFIRSSPDHGGVAAFQALGISELHSGILSRPVVPTKGFPGSCNAFH